MVSDEVYRIPVNLDDITFVSDFKSELIKDLGKLRYAQAFMWLAIKFVNEASDYVTAKALSHELWGGKDASYSIKILLRFCGLRVLRTERKVGTKVRYFYLYADRSIFREHYDLAMSTINLAKGDSNGENGPQ